MSRRRYRRRGRPGSISGQFSARTIEMLESPPWRAQSLSARRALDRIEIERAHHGGKDNGRLPVTYNDFEDYGIDRHAIAPAIRELEALGLIEITEVGRAGNAEWRKPNLFRLTYRSTAKAPPTEDWRRIRTMARAEEIARNARVPIKRPKKQKPVRGNTAGHLGHPHLAPVRTSHTTRHGEKPTPLSISRGGELQRRAHPKRLRVLFNQPD
jgi:hypothetical protein